MKLNPNCMRDILFYLEEHLDISPELEYSEIDSYDLKNHLEYSIQEITNTLIVLRDAGFIKLATDGTLRQMCVYLITYDGYQFIETIRPESVWKKVLSVTGQIGCFSIDIISNVATNVLSSMIPLALSSLANMH